MANLDFLSAPIPIAKANGSSFAPVISPAPFPAGIATPKTASIASPAPKPISFLPIENGHITPPTELGKTTQGAIKEFAESGIESIANFANNLKDLVWDTTAAPLIKATTGINASSSANKDLNFPQFTHTPKPGMEPASTAGNIVGSVIPYIGGGEVLKPVSALLSKAPTLIRILGTGLMNAGIPAVINQVAPLEQIKDGDYSHQQTHWGRFVADLPSNLLFGLTSLIGGKPIVSALATGGSQFALGASQGKDLTSNIVNSTVLTLFGLTGHGQTDQKSDINTVEGMRQRAQEVLNTDLGPNPTPQDQAVKEAAKSFLESNPAEQQSFIGQAKAIWQKVVDHYNSIPNKQGGIIKNPFYKGEENLTPVDVINKHIDTANEVLDNPDTKDILKTNTEHPKEYLNQVQNEIATGLKAEGFEAESKAVASLDAQSYGSIEELASAAHEAVRSLKIAPSEATNPLAALSKPIDIVGEKPTANFDFMTKPIEIKTKEEVPAKVAEAVQKKSQFESKQIRPLTEEEKPALAKINLVLSGESNSESISDIPGFVSEDGKKRPLIFNNIVAPKVAEGGKHGQMTPENLVINANDWEGVLKNVREFENGKLGKPNPDKINLIKRIPDSDNVLLIGADRENGYFMLTHYEIKPIEGNEIKSLLGRGDLFTPDGTPLGPKDFLTTPPAQGSLEGVLGRGGNDTLHNKDKEVNKTLQAEKDAERSQAGAMKEAKNYTNSEELMKSLEERKASLEKIHTDDPKDKVIIRAMESLDRKIQEAKNLPADAFGHNIVEKTPAPKAEPTGDKAFKMRNLYYLNLEKSFLEDAIKQNSAKELKRYMIDGALPEVTGKEFKRSTSRTGKMVKNSLYGRFGDDIAKTHGFEDTAHADVEFEKLQKNEKRLQEIKKEIADSKRELANDNKDVKDKAAMNRFLNQSFKDQGQEIHEAANLERAKAEGYDEVITKANGGVTPKAVRGGIKSPELDFEHWKDPSLFGMNRDTLERNVDKFAPEKDAKAIKEFMVDPLRENEKNAVKAKNARKIEVKAKMKELGIKPNSKEDLLIRLLGEKKINMDSAIASSDNIEGIQKMISWYRNNYEDIIDNEWNPKRAEFGYKPVPKRENYFRHASDISWFTDNFGFLKDDKELPTSIVGETQYYKPGKPFSTAELRRLGNKTNISASRGYDNYLESVYKQIYHIDSIQRGRAILKYLNDVAKAKEEEGQPLQLQNVKQNITQFVDSGIAGKQATLDRGIEGLVGRGWIQRINAFSRYIGNNIILGNISAAMSHLASLPLNFATTAKGALAKGIMHTMTSPLKEAPFTMIDGQESSFLTRRYPEGKIAPKWWETMKDTMNFVMDTADKFKTKLAVSGKYYEGLDNGLSKEAAMKQADEYAGKIIGDYSLGNKPNFFNNRALGPLVQFQLGMNDGLSVLLHDIPKDNEGNKYAIASKYAQFVIYSYLLNKMYKNVGHGEKGINPLEWALTLLGLNDEGKDKALFDRVKTAGGQAASELPFLNMFTGQFPVATTLKYAGTDVMGLIKDLTAEEWWKATGDVGNLASTFEPFGGGTQIRKTVLGILADTKGSYTKGKQEIKIDPSLWNKLKTAVLGTSAATPLSKSSGLPPMPKLNLPSLHLSTGGKPLPKLNLPPLKLHLKK
ncbi:MAG: hypothetical protein V4438_04250 [Patescibacteria group bacterium]